jgi:hypothetical protein
MERGTDCDNAAAGCPSQQAEENSVASHVNFLLYCQGAAAEDREKRFHPRSLVMCHANSIDVFQNYRFYRSSMDKDRSQGEGRFCGAKGIQTT